MSTDLLSFVVFLPSSSFRFAVDLCFVTKHLLINQLLSDVKFTVVDVAEASVRPSLQVISPPTNADRHQAPVSV